MPALNSSMLKMIFCILMSPYCYRKGLSFISRRGLSVCWSLLCHLLRKWTLKDLCIFYSFSETLRECLPSQVWQGCRHRTDLSNFTCCCSQTPLDQFDACQCFSWGKGLIQILGKFMGQGQETLILLVQALRGNTASQIIESSKN